jgi:flagellar biosynthetic protein FlhB
VAEEQDNAQKTEEPTPKRREEAREKGQIPTSREVATAALMLAALGVMYFGVSELGTRLVGTMHDFFTFNDWRNLDIDKTTAGLREVGASLAYILIPVLAPLVVAAIGSYVIQTRLNFSLEPIKPKASKISPLKGLQKIFSARGLTEFGKSLFKVAVIGAIGWAVLSGWWEVLRSSPALSVAQGMQVLHEILMMVLLLSVVAFLLLGALDYAFQFQQNEQQLRMTKREVEEEQKQTEGDPHIKQQRQKRHQEMSRGRMMEEVPESDVVITNPTHLAIALRYDQSQAPAPQVVAKGRGHLAQRIRETAEAAGVPVVERREVAQTLYKHTELGDMIPEDLFRVIAEILAWVYRQQPEKASDRSAGRARAT